MSVFSDRQKEHQAYVSGLGAQTKQGQGDLVEGKLAPADAVETKATPDLEAVAAQATAANRAGLERD